MSWLARSLANSLIADDQRHVGDEDEASTEGDRRSMEPDRIQDDAGADPNRGVREDLSELTETLTRSMWGVASFLAPPAPTSSDPDPHPSDPTNSEAVSSPRIAGIRNDFAEIGGRFRSGISRLSSNLIPFGSEQDEGEEEEEEEEEEEDVVGVTEEVMAFVRNIAMHPETWIDFPLFNEFEDTNDFEMSDAQQEHAFAVTSLVPRLAALRIELCPAHMTEGCFWKIYFVLLHSRLNKHDAEHLSTPQIAEARAMLSQKLYNRKKPDSELYTRGLTYRNSDIPSVSPRASQTNPSNFNSSEGPTSTWSTHLETEKCAVDSSEVEIIDKSIIKEEPATEQKNKDLIISNFSDISIWDYDDGEDDWLEDEAAGVSGCNPIPFANDEDVSFSDLEDEDDPRAPSSSKTVISKMKASTTVNPIPFANDQAGGVSESNPIPFANDEDVSFSDLEDEDDPKAVISIVKDSTASFFASNRSER